MQHEIQRATIVFVKNKGLPEAVNFVDREEYNNK
jgi:hypothetical protein